MRLFTALITALLIAGCTTMPSQPVQQAKWSPDLYYGEARKAQANGEYETAIKYFSELEILYPLSPYAQLAPIEMAYGHYKLKDFEATIRETERFINTYPNHNNVDYAYYLKGLARSDLALGKTDSQPPSADTLNTDQVRLAFIDFSTVVQKFPDSKYRDSAMQHMNTLRNQLARHELQTVKTKLAEGDNEGALRLAKYISEQYPKTAAAAEAFEIVTEASSTMVAPDTASQPAMSAIETQPIEQQAAQSANEKISREAWLLQQNPTHFTLQLIGTSNQDKLETYIKKHKLQDKAAYFHRTLNNKNWYSLLYGNFNQHDTAAAQAKQLKQTLGLDRVWIRQFKDVQASIAQSQTE